MADMLMTPADRQSMRDLPGKLAARWVDNLAYWVSNRRTVQGSQTVEYISAQATHCAIHTVRALRNEAVKNGRPFLDLTKA